MQELGEALRIAFGKFRRKFALQNAAIDRPHLSWKRLSISRDANDLPASICVTPAPLDITHFGDKSLARPGDPRRLSPLDRIGACPQPNKRGRQLAALD